MPNPARLEAILKGIAGSAPESKYIRAYHGSPYDFDRFDASKIGTGEGAQAYGHGLYFAGSEDVALGYRDRLKDAVEREIPSDLLNAYAEATQNMLRHHRLRGELAKASPAAEYPDLQSLNEATAAFYDLQHRVNAAAQNPGRMYEVELGVPEESLLDWDRPVHKQPDQIYDALGWNANPSLANTLGREGWLGRSAYYKMAEEMGGADKAARRLLDSGVHGIRYLDGNSRSAGQGTRNFVMFPGTEDSIRILRKYGVMAPIPMAAGSATMDE